MSDQDTYELRTMHCPTGCGHEATHRAVVRMGKSRCPRCEGALLEEFIDDAHGAMIERPFIGLRGEELE